MHKIVAVGAALLTVLVAPVPGSAATPESWQVDVSTVDADDAGVVAVDDGLRLATDGTRAASADEPGRGGVLVVAPHRLRVPAGRVTVTVDAERPVGTEVLVDVRGVRADGTVTEWAPSPAELAEPAAVQVRLILRSTTGATRPASATGVTPVVHAAVATAEPTAPAEPTGPAATAGPATPVASAEPAGPVGAHDGTATSPAQRSTPLAFVVFATREGLVGHTTANGHVIAERDHFVALPSRRGLSVRGGGDYSVMVCARNGRCAWAPVWDVGPWNTRDDYWNPAGTRQMWADLPHGKPQAQAAHLDGYNGGRDQYDREVRNPAGIDLADGTFWDGLGLRDNAWVTVTYLWTARGERTGTVVTTGGPLNVRATPGTEHPPVGMAGNRARVHVECQTPGQPATGTQGSSDRWLRIAPGRYVAAAYVAVGHEVPGCS